MVASPRSNRFVSDSSDLRIDGENTLLWPWLLDPDITQVERLAGLDGELLADLRAGHTARRVVKSMNRYVEPGIRAGSVMRPSASETSSDL